MVAACSNGEQRVVEGLILDVRPGQVLVEHGNVEGLTGPGLSTFGVRDPAVLEKLKPGDTIRAGVYIDQAGAYMVRLRKTGEGKLPAEYTAEKYRLQGVVVEVREGSIVLDHEPIAGVMGAMVMPFAVKEQSDIEGLVAGDKVLGTYFVDGTSTWAGDLQKVGADKKVYRQDVSPIRVGERFPPTRLVLDDGSEFILGKDGGRPIALTYIYTRCPEPEACPAMMARYQALHAAVGDRVLLLAVTLDPAHDSPEVLSEYAKGLGVNGPDWRFARVDQGVLEEMALQSGMNVIEDEGKIVHGLRVLILDKSGTLIERYDDARWPLDRLTSQLLTGEPKARLDTLGSHYPKTED